MPERRTRLKISKRVASGTQHLTPEYIHRALDRSHERYRSRNELMVELRKMRFMQDKDSNEVPENLREGNPPIRTYLAGRWVENEVGALTTLPPRFHVPLPAVATIEDRTRAELIERFLPAFWERSEVERGRDTYRNLFDNAIADGVGVLKAIYKPSAWQTMPKATEFSKKVTPDMDYRQALGSMSDVEADGYARMVDRYVRNTDLPISFRTVDPLTVFPIWGEFGLDCVLEESRRSLIAVKRMAGPFGGVPLTADDGETGDMIRVVEYWDDEHFAVYAELSPRGTTLGLGPSGGLQLIGTMEHKLGRIPYWFVYGQETSSTDPRYEAVSTLFKVKDAVPTFHRVLNQYLTIVRQKAYPTFQQKRAPTGPTDAASEPLKQKAKPGEIIYVDDSIEDPFIRAIEWPAQEINLPVVLNMLLALGEQTQMSDAATGGSSSSGESGYLRAQLVDLARTGYHQIIAHGERAFSSASEWVLEMIDRRLKRDIYVRAYHGQEGQRRQWLAIGPDVIEGDYAVDVRIVPFNPIMDIARGTFGANMILQKVYPRKWTYENIMGVENGQELVDELYVDAMEQSPPVQQALQLRAARKAKLTELAGSQQPVTPAEAQIMAAMGGSMGGRPVGSPATPAAGMPTANPANSGQAVPIGPAGGQQ